MISFVLTCTELQKDMLTEIERLYERNIRTRFIKERLLYQKYRQIKDDEAHQLKGELTQYKSLVHEMGKMISRDWKLNATTWNKLTDEYLGSEEE